MRGDRAFLITLGREHTINGQTGGDGLHPREREVSSQLGSVTIINRRTRPDPGAIIGLCLNHSSRPDRPGAINPSAMAIVDRATAGPTAAPEGRPKLDKARAAGRQEDTSAVSGVTED